MSSSVIAALVLVVLLASTAQQAIGFGATVIVVALSALFVPLQLVLPAFVPVNTALSAFTALRRASQVRLRVLVFEFLPPLLPGLGLGLLTFRYSAHAGLKLAFGGFVSVLASVELLRLRAASAEPSAPLPRLIRGLMVFFGGYIHGVFGSGGPLLVYVLRRRLPDKGELRATLALLWCLLNLPLLVNFRSLGLLRGDSLRLSLLLALPFLPAVLLGDLLHRRLPPRRFQIWVCVLLLIAGLSLTIHTVLAAR
ncbi:MAG TPA: TSUP family transporter [Pseudomonadota bacterium]|nr:TSUP family transporter [Pseudomonadota bacterium]